MQALVCWCIKLCLLSQTKLHMQPSSSKTNRIIQACQPSGANNILEDEKLEWQVPFPRPLRRPLPFSTSNGNEGDNDDPLEAIHAVNSKMNYNSILIKSWHWNCVEDEATLVDLNIRVN